MTKVNSTTTGHNRKPRKPDKPYKDFPLTAHPCGLWCKKIRARVGGKTLDSQMVYFGSWRTDPKGTRALEQWLNDKDDLLAGRVPRSRAADGVPVLRDLINRFLTAKTLMLSANDQEQCKKFLKKKSGTVELEAVAPSGEPSRAKGKGELSIHTWNSYRERSEDLIEAFGATRLLTDILPEDFDQLRAKWAAKWGPVRLGAEINRSRVIFNYAWKVRMIPEPMNFGENFKRPSKKVMRRNREEQGPKMYEAEELRRMIDAAAQPMKAMLLLAINAGLGNNDIGQLPLKALDLTGGWLNYPRPKTEVKRRVPLWPETTAALQEWLAMRPTNAKSEEHAALVFLTFRGNGWTKDLKDRPITKETRKLLDKLGISGNRNFYAIRHTTETIGGESRDQVAVNAVMGHDDGSMASVYRERISDERLRAVTDLVRHWLFVPALKIADEGEAASA